MRYFATDYPPLRGQGKENAENLSEQSKTVNRAAEEWRACGRMKHTDLIRRLEQKDGILLRHDARHNWYHNPTTRAS
jgi:hypothetical protein